MTNASLYGRIRFVTLWWRTLDKLEVSLRSQRLDACSSVRRKWKRDLNRKSPPLTSARQCPCLSQATECQADVPNAGQGEPACECLR